MPSSGLKLYGASTRVLKVDLVASFANVELEKPPFTMGITNKTPRYVALNPLGKVTFHYATLFYVASIKTAFCSIYRRYCLATTSGISFLRHFLFYKQVPMLRSPVISFCRPDNKYSCLQK